MVCKLAQSQHEMLSCLFVIFERQQTWMQQAFQNPSVRKTLLSFVWWTPEKSPGFRIHQRFHQVLKFTRFSPRFGYHQEFTKFWTFTRYWKFTRIFFKVSPGFGNSSGFHQVFTRFSDFLTKPWRSIRRFQNCISFHCSDGRYVILKEAFFRHQFQGKNARRVLYSLLNTQNTSLEWNVGGSLANPP